MNVYQYSYDELKACRVCLNTDTKLFHLHRFDLLQTLYEFSGTHITNSDGLPQYICFLCYALLKKSSVFRNKCRNSHSLLLNHLLQTHCLTTNCLKTLNTDAGQFLSKTEVHNTSYPGLENEDILTINIKQEYDNDFENNHLNYYDENSSHEFEEILKKDSVKPETDSKDKIKKRKRKIKDSKARDERIKEFSIKYIESNQDTEKKLFYEYILDKYLKKDRKKKDIHSFNVKLDSKEIKHEINSIFISVESELTDTNKQIKIPTEYRKRFYEHIVNKYKNNSPNKNKKVTDVTRMRERKDRKRRRRSRTKDDLSNFSKAYNVDIKMLNRDEQIADVLSRRETEKYKKAMFKCQLCYRGFTAEKAFQNHSAIHDNSVGPFVCEICHVRFAKRGRLTKHVQLRHKFKFQCKLCSQVTRNSTCAREHYKCHAGFKYECEHCGKVFSKYASRINHIRIFHGTVTCDICRESFAGETGLLTHKTKAHREIFKCLCCGVQFHNPDALKKHTDLLLGDVCGPHIRPCTQCGDNFPNEDIMKGHMLEYHNKQKPRGRTQHKPSLKLGTEPKPNVKWLAKRTPRAKSCLQSDEDQTLENQTTYRKKAEKVDKLMCEMCAADGFASEAVLRYHQRIHTGEKPHPCPHCTKRFRIRELLQKHMRTHTGDRPYKCAHCPKAFKTASAHYTHQVVHTKIRRHRCHLCDKMFLTSTCVKTHIKTVHMKLPSAPRVRQQGPLQRDESLRDVYIPDLSGY